MDSQDSEKKHDQRETRRQPSRPEKEFNPNQFHHSPFQRREFTVQPYYPPPNVSRRGSFIEEERLPDIRLVPDPERYNNSTEVKSAIDFIQRVKAYYSEDSPTFIGFLETMHDFKTGKLKADDVVTGVAILFGGNEQLLNEFKKFVPPTYHSILKHHPPSQKEIPQQMPPQRNIMPLIQEEDSRIESTSSTKSQKFVAAEFISLVKQRLDSKGQVYEEFIKILSGLKDNPNHDQSFNKIEKCLVDYPDLLAHFYKFLPFDRPISVESDTTTALLDRIKNLGIYDDFMRCINSYNQNILSSKDLMTLLKPIIRDENLLSELKKYIKYDEVDLSDLPLKKVKTTEKIGSYRILSEDNKINYDDHGDVLNRSCILCLTQDREDQTYIFMKRNIYEENLFRIEDERYDADLTLGRLESLIIALEKVLTNPLAEDSEIYMSSLDMSSGIIQELLEGIYGESANDVTESMLNKPLQAIPVVLSRLYTVYKQWSREKAEKNKMWEVATRENYYKALDSIYSDFKHQDKKFLSYKTLAKDMINTWDVSDKYTFKLIHELILLFAETGGFAEADFVETIKAILDLFNSSKSEIVFYANPYIFCIFSYIIVIYERLKEALEISLPPISSNNLAVELGLIQPRNVENRRDEIIKLVREYLEGKIKSEHYEEELRIISGNHAYKLFNIDKIMSKIEDRIVNIRADVLNKDILEDIFAGRSKLRKVEDTGAETIYKFVIRNKELVIEKMIIPSPGDTSKFIERFKNLEYDAEDIKTRVFLESSLKKYNGGLFYFNVEHRVCPKTMRLSYIGGTEDFFMRYEYKRGITDNEEQESIKSEQ